VSFGRYAATNVSQKYAAPTFNVEGPRKPKKVEAGFLLTFFPKAVDTDS